MMEHHDYYKTQCYTLFIFGLIYYGIKYVRYINLLDCSSGVYGEKINVQILLGMLMTQLVNQRVNMRISMIDFTKIMSNLVNFRKN